MADQQQPDAEGLPTLRVIGGLSTSLLAGWHLPPADYQPPDEGSEPYKDARQNLIDHITAQRPGSPASELTGLPKVWDHAGQPGRVEVVLLYDEDDALHRFVLDCLEHLAPTLFDGKGVDVEVIGVHAGPAPVRVAHAEQAVRRVPDVIADWLFEDDVQVVVNGAAGVSTTKVLLAGLAAVRGAPVFVTPETEKQDLAFLELPPVSLDRAETWRRLDAVEDELLAAGRSPPARVTPGFSALVVDDPPRPSRIVVHYARAATQTPLLRGYPACAALLERAGEPQLAAQLRALVDHWVTQRLWAFNLAPELVAHDDRHSERVDHLLATLLLPLVAEKAIVPDEVFLLSCAAWLHDWGHVGAHLGNGFVTHPIDVRSLHGLLTDARLRDFPQLHGLDLAIAAKVGVLAAHHQGWTSCDDTPATPDEVTRDALTRFDVAPATLDRDACDAGLEPGRARLLLALLRVADAADVGVHRAPQHASLGDYLRSCAQHAISRAAAEAPLATSPEVREALTTLSRQPDDADAKEELNARSADRFVARILHYLEFIPQQQHHFDLHSSVLHVRFTHADGGFTTVVTPAPGVDSDDAVSQVETFVRKELSRPAKTCAIGTLLDEVGLRYQGGALAT